MNAKLPPQIPDMSAVDVFTINRAANGFIFRAQSPPGSLPPVRQNFVFNSAAELAEALPTLLEGFNRVVPAQEGGAQ